MGTDASEKMDRCGRFAADDPKVRQASGPSITFNDLLEASMGANVDYEVSSLSHAGLIRGHNEDSFLVDDDLGLFLVADGMGGHRAGDVASQLGVKAVHDRLKVVLPRTASDANASMQAIRDAIGYANGMIFKASRSGGETTGMGTTITLLLLRGRTALVAHVGDSRVYRLRDGRLEALTRDHSLLQAQVGAGIISGEEARFSHNRNLVTRALGIEASTQADLMEVELRRGDLFLLCSDGLNTMLDDSDIELILSELDANLPLATKCLVEIANDNGGHDNVTVVAVHIREPGDGISRGLFARLFGWLFGK
jgi:protein phosphatase